MHLLLALAIAGVANALHLQGSKLAQRLVTTQVENETLTDIKRQVRKDYIRISAVISLSNLCCSSFKWQRDALALRESVVHKDLCCIFLKKSRQCC